MSEDGTHKYQTNEKILDFIDKSLEDPNVKNNPVMITALAELFHETISY
ncbi:hypothetical protein [Fructilactobacillus fructivorans]|nr:hypothetical protein [Fructilactobacillus fructivorans]